MLSLILIAVGIIFKAVADTLAHHFSTSIFKKLNKRFWDASDKYAPKPLKHTKYPLDAWHLSNSLFQLCMIVAVVTYSPLFSRLVDFGLASLILVIFFNTFYNKILR